MTKPLDEPLRDVDPVTLTEIEELRDVLCELEAQLQDVTNQLADAAQRLADILEDLEGNPED